MSCIMIILTKIEQTCSACPAQWDGFEEDGTYYYIRYRWGHLTVNRGAVNGEEIYSEYIGGGLDGYMHTDEMFAHTGMILQGRI